MYIFDNKEMTSREILDCISSNRYKIEDLYLNLKNMNYSEILRLKVESLVFGRYMEADKLNRVLLFLTKINVQKLKEDISLMVEFLKYEMIKTWEKTLDRKYQVNKLRKKKLCDYLENLAIKKKA